MLWRIRNITQKKKQQRIFQASKNTNGIYIISNDPICVCVKKEAFTSNNTPYVTLIGMV